MRALYVFALLGTLLLTGCAGNPMTPVADQTLPAAAPDMAQVVFMRDAFTGKAITSSLYDVTDGKTQFIGVMANGTKIAHPVTAGKHTFMVVSEAADFMEADLVAGQNLLRAGNAAYGFLESPFLSVAGQQRPGCVPQSEVEKLPGLG